MIVNMECSMKRHLARTVSNLAFAVLVSATMFAPAAYAVTDEEIAAFVEANKNDPAKIAAAMKEHGVSVDRIQKAGGYSDAQIDDYVGKSNNADLQNSLDKSKGKKFSDKQIDTYLRENIDNPDAIAKAMDKYGVDIGRVQKAGGYTDAQVGDYVGKSNNAALKASLRESIIASRSPIYAGLPDSMISTSGGQAIAVIRNASEIDKLPIWKSMDPAVAAEKKAGILLALNSVQETGGGHLLGIDGFQISIPGPNHPDYAYPPMSAKDVNGLKNQLKQLEPSAILAQKNLESCVKAGTDCASERNAFALMRAKTSEIGSQIAAAEADARILTMTDPEKKLMASVNASGAASNAYLACTAVASQTGSDCSAQADLAMKQLTNMKTSSRAIVDKCVSDFGAESPKCTPLYAQAHAMENSLSGFEEKVKVFEAGRTTPTKSATLDRIRNEAAKSITGSATPVTITLPAEGEKELANGYSVDANGVIKDANDKFVAKLSDSGKLTDMAGKASDALSSTQLSDLFKSQPPADNYARCEMVIRQNNCGSYATVATGPSTLPAVAQAPTNDQFVQKNGYVAATDTGEVVKQTVTNTQINDFIRGNLKEPAKIAEAMKKYNVDLKRIQLATNYERQEMIDYINKSGDKDLLEILNKSKNF